MLSFNQDEVSISFSAELDVKPSSCALSIEENLLADLTTVVRENGLLKCTFEMRNSLTSVTQANLRLYDSQGNLMQNEKV